MGCLLLLSVVFAVACAVYADDPFLQVTAEQFTFAGEKPTANWKQAPFPSAIDAVVCDGDAVFLDASGAVWTMKGKLAGPFAGAERLTCNFAVGPSFAVNYLEDTILARLNLSSINDVAEWSGGLLVAHDHGVAQIVNSTVSPVKISSVGLDNSTVRVKSVAAQGSTVVFGTDWALWVSNDAMQSFYFERVPGVIDLGGCNALAFDKDSLWCGTAECVSSRDRTDFSLKRICGNQGLCASNITSIQVVKTGIWFGTESGVVFRSNDSGAFQFFSGARFLAAPDLLSSRVVALAADFDSSTATVVTEMGVSILTFLNLTLATKASMLEQIMARHQQTSLKNLPNGSYLAGDCQLSKFGDVTSFVPVSNDNNGLWTSMYLMGQCFRYQLEKTPQVKENAWKYFMGLKLLNDATGIKGLVARSVMWSPTNPNQPGSSQWQPVSFLPMHWWKSDTSSDEISGHLAVYGLVHDFLAETAEEKAIARDLIVNMVSYIVRNGFRLIDWTGRPTSWGHWDPQVLNFNFSSWYDIRGLNSLQILSWIRIGRSYAIDSESQALFDEAFTNLTKTYMYDLNIINARITEIDDVDYSDDELMFLNYFSWIWGKKSNLTSIHFDASIRRSFKVVKDYRNPLYWAVAALYDSRLAGDSKHALQTLREWPISHVNWAIDNSKRIDIRFVDALDEVNNANSVTLINYGEGRCLRFNCDVYNLDPSGNGFSETEPGAFLLAHYFSKWLNQ